MKLLIRSFLIALLLSTGCTVNASPAVMNASQIRHEMEKLKTAGSVLFIAAHPDDENTGLLAWLVNEKKLRTGYLSLTRGEGGQNLIGTEQGELLGLIRTQELLAARKIDGAEQFFTRAYDFGYSKTSDETLSLWDRDSVLSDMVFIIRKFRPDVIILRFPPTSAGGHGHHSASAILGEEAFAAAANPDRYKWQLNHVDTWQARRLFWNSYRFSTVNTTSEDHMKIETGQYNPLLGYSYGELAAISRSQHRCQGMGSAQDHATRTEYFKQLAGDSAQNDLFSGMDLTWKRYSNDKAGIQKRINDLIANYDMQQPEKSVAMLGELYEAVETVDDETWKEYTLKRLSNLIIACSGIYFEASAPSQWVTPGESFKTILQLFQRKPSVLKCMGYIIPGNGEATGPEDYIIKDGIELKNNVFRDTIILNIPKEHPVSTPWFLKNPRAGNSYVSQDINYTGLPEAKSPVAVKWMFSWGNSKTIVINTPVIFKRTDPELGELKQNVSVVPPVSLKFSDLNYHFSNAMPETVNITIESFADSIDGFVTLQIPTGWRFVPERIPVKLSGKRQSFTASFKVSPGVSPSKDQVLQASAVFESSGKKITDNVTVISYEHIPDQVITQPVKTNFVYAPLNVNAKTVAYLSGAGDETESAVRQMGVNVIRLTPELLADSTQWNKWDAVITGVRYFNVSERADAELKNLLQYAESGGTVLIQYNTDSRMKVPFPGPYPFSLSRKRVTYETAAVTFLNENHPLLNSPNKITSDDFEKWVQERGLYYPDKADDRYTRLLSMNDPEEEPLNTGLLYTAFGKGHFIYTSLAFFRQLPAGNPGAYRLFANLISKRQQVK